MSAFRDGLSSEKRVRYDAAIAAAGLGLARACADRDGLAAAEGPGAVAEAAWYPGHHLGSPGAIEARYLELHAAARSPRPAACSSRYLASIAPGEPRW